MLENVGVMKSIKRVVGVSVGVIIVIFIVFGYDFCELREFLE